MDIERQPTGTSDAAGGHAGLEACDILITAELESRTRRSPNLAAEAEAFRELAARMIEHPAKAIRRFTELALELCHAGSAGLSTIEFDHDGTQRFRWDAVVGALESYIGGTTPFDFSPFGLCLQEKQTILLRRPFEYFDYLKNPDHPLMEGMVVPLYDTGRHAFGTIWVVHHDAARHFDAEDARILEQLAIQLILALKLRQDESLHVLNAQEAERWQLVSKELQHRIKNTLAIINAIVGQSLDHASSLAAARSAINDRIASLSRAHELLHSSSGKETSMRAIIDAALAPHILSGNGVTIEGPDIVLPENKATSLVLALNELATNAVKYGALSTNNGRVELSWTMEDVNGEENLSLSWQEFDGPPVIEPEHKGFGSRLIEKATANAFGGEVRMHYDPAGVRCLLKAPLPGSPGDSP